MSLEDLRAKDMSAHTHTHKCTDLPSSTRTSSICDRLATKARNSESKLFGPLPSIVRKCFRDGVSHGCHRMAAPTDP